MQYEHLTDERADELASGIASRLPSMGVNESGEGDVTVRNDITGHLTPTSAGPVTEFRIEDVTDVYVEDIIPLLDEDEYVASFGTHFDDVSVTMTVVTEGTNTSGVFL